MKTLTCNQRDALQRVRSIRDLHMASLRKAIAENSWMEGCTPSEWVPWVTLVQTHHINKGTISQLVKKGYLEMRPTDGWGPEVRVT